MVALLQPWAIRDIAFRNRIFVSPMCQYSASDGHLTDWHFVHLGSRAVGGAGMIVIEASAVTAAGRITYGDSGIWRDDHIATHKRVVDFMHAQGTTVGLQIAHAGRKASCVASWHGGVGR